MQFHCNFPAIMMKLIIRLGPTVLLGITILVDGYYQSGRLSSTTGTSIAYHSNLIQTAADNSNMANNHRPPSSGSSRALYAKKQSRSNGNDNSKQQSRSGVQLVSVDSIYTDERKLQKSVDILLQGGVIVIPTDTCYSFATLLSSREGVKRLLDLKGFHGQKKPLSLLCKDISMISKYTSSLLADQRWMFKLLRDKLPGPYTFIMPASSEVPKMVLEPSKKHSKLRVWKRKEVGVRMPNDLVCLHILQQLQEPLLCGSIPESDEDIIGILTDLIDDEEEEEDDDNIDNSTGRPSVEDALLSGFVDCSWVKGVDLIVENGQRGGSTAGSYSTVVDFTTGLPVVIRQGKGDFDVDAISAMG